MEFQRVVDSRRMIRNYTDESVDTEVVERVLRNAVRAPSAGYSQGWGFLVLDTPEDMERFWACTVDAESGLDDWLAGMKSAKVLIVALSCKRVYLDRYAQTDKGWTDRDEARWPVPYWDVDTGMAALLMHLTAVDEGLGSCIFGIPPAEIPAFRATFGVPEDHTPVAVLSIGQRADSEKVQGSWARRRRRPLDDVVHRGHW